MKPDYVHGYSPRESVRLIDQATTLTSLLHADSVYPPNTLILEAGCGVGAQTVTLASQNPKARFLSVDISPTSLAEAERRVTEAGLENVQFQRADIFRLPFEADSFDHVFVCFVLEHLTQPIAALERLKQVLKPGGSLTVIEGDHGSVFFHPEAPNARRAIQCLIELQAQSGGNSLIGRALFPLLTQAGLRQVTLSPRMVYVDSSRPQLVEGFTKNTFTAMVEGVRESALAHKLIEPAIWDQGIAELYRTAESDGTFCYTFFKAVGWK